MAKTRNQSRTSLFRQRAELSKELQNLKTSCENLEAQYKEAKPEEATTMGTIVAIASVGFFSQKTPNENRLAAIKDINAVIQLIDQQFQDAGFSIAKMRPSPSDAQLNSDIAMYELALNQVKGAIVSTAQSIDATYIISSPTNSELFKALTNIVDYKSMDEAAVKVMTDAHNDLISELESKDEQAKSATVAV